MGGPRITVPLFITCAWAPCGAVVPVVTRHEQRLQRFCSRTCAYKGRTHGGGFTKEQMAKGGQMRGQRARAALMQTVAGMDSIDAFRLGYLKGLKSKHRQIKARRLRKDAA